MDYETGLEDELSQRLDVMGTKKLTKTNDWTFSNNDFFIQEILDDIGVGILKEDDDDCLEECQKIYTRSKIAKKETEKSTAKPTVWGPTPPGNSTSCTAPPKHKHHRSESTKKQQSDDQTPFKVRRRMRVDGPTGKDTFAGMSDEIILQVFQWLPKSSLINCSRTCKRWKRLSYDHSLWRRMNLGEQNVASDTLGHLLQRGTVILRLAKSDIQEPQNIELPMSFPTIQNRRFCKLQHLDLSMAIISVHGLEEILSVCNQLRNISLEHCEISNTICRHLGNNKLLDQLNLSSCKGLTPIGIKYITNGCQRLTAVNLAWTSLCKSAINVAVKNLPTGLKRLNLSGCQYTIMDKHVADLVKRCSDLEELDLSDSLHLTEESIFMIHSYLYELEDLSLSRCYNIAKDSYEDLAHLNYLENLQIFGLFNSKELANIQIQLPRVKINKMPFSKIARPTTGIHRTSIWGLRVRD